MTAACAPKAYAEFGWKSQKAGAYLLTIIRDAGSCGSRGQRGYVLLRRLDDNVGIVCKSGAGCCTKASCLTRPSKRTSHCGAAPPPPAQLRDLCSWRPRHETQHSRLLRQAGLKLLAR